MKKLFILLIGCVLLVSCGGGDDPKPKNVVTVDKTTVNVETSEESSGSFSLTSSSSWNIVVPTNARSWCSVEPESGAAGSAVNITVRIKENTSKNTRTTKLAIKVGTVTEREVTIIQAAGPNQPPTAPQLTRPVNSAANISICPEFAWKTSFDTDDDVYTLKYIVEYSLNENFSVSSKFEGSNVSSFPPQLLKSNSKYYYRIQAYDPYGGYSDYSDTYTFTTSSETGYSDGEWVRCQTASAGAPQPVYLVFMGDGYTVQDHIRGKAYDQNMDEGIEAFFSVEPYKTYRKYFTVYKVAAYSNQRGMSGGTFGTKDTKFKVTMTGTSSTNLTCDKDLVTEYAKKTDIPSTAYSTLAIVVVANENQYAGTCSYWSTGRSISMVPLSRRTDYNGRYSFPNVIVHEAGGHGFGLLGDEYSTGGATTITSDRIANFKTWVNYNPSRHKNLDLTADRSLIKWKHFFSIDGYYGTGIDGYNTDVHEGGYTHVRGVWRPEVNSCMTSNYLYFNAPSRESIVQRIMTLSGKTYNIDEFLAIDRQNASAAATMGLSRALPDPFFIPLGEPVAED